MLILEIIDFFRFEIVEVGRRSGTFDIVSAKADECAGKVKFVAVIVGETCGIEDGADGLPFHSVG